MPFEIQLFKIHDNGAYIKSLHSFNIFAQMLSQPDDFLESKFSIICLTSNADTNLISKCLPDSFKVRF